MTSWTSAGSGGISLLPIIQVLSMVSQTVLRVCQKVSQFQWETRVGPVRACIAHDAARPVYFTLLSDARRLATQRGHPSPQSLIPPLDDLPVEGDLISMLGVVSRSRPTLRYDSLTGTSARGSG